MIKGMYLDKFPAQMFPTKQNNDKRVKTNSLLLYHQGFTLICSNTTIITSLKHYPANGYDLTWLDMSGQYGFCPDMLVVERNVLRKICIHYIEQPLLVT